MTYIEFFDETAAENVSSCLTYRPDRVIYITDKAKTAMRHVANYQKLFRSRGYQIELKVETASKSNLDHAVGVLSRLVETYDDCVFDITGGEEIYIFALGIVFAKYPDKKIQIHKFNLRNNTLYDCDKDGVTVYRDAPMLSVEENIQIYGGEIAYGEAHEAKTFRWDLNPEFLQDIEQMWTVCKDNIRYWNLQMTILACAEIVGSCSSDGLTTVVSRAALVQYLEEKNYRFKLVMQIIAPLLQHGLITYFDDDVTNITISYKNRQVKRCLTKAGQVLELKTYSIVKNICDKDGAKVYQDAMNGVLIDWDGEFHDEAAEEIYDTENEVDIILMHGIVPVFISCKNGKSISNEELYKLNTVAERFGGRYAKKVLVTTSVEEMGEPGLYLKQRAIDMDIKLIDRVQDLTDEEFEKKLKYLWSND